MTALAAIFAVMGCIFVGEWVSKITHAYLPSVFVSAMLFVVGYWTIFPKDLSAQASFNMTAVNMFMALSLVHLGTLMSLKKLLQQWRAVCIALLGVCGTIILTMLIGTKLFNWHTVVAAVPPLTGGIVAALLMSNGLREQGIMTLVALPIAMMVTHSLVGYPLTSTLLKQEGKRLIKKFRGDPKLQEQIAQAGANSDSSAAIMEGPAKKTIFTVPERYDTAAFIIAKVAFVAVLATAFAKLLNNVINPNVMCLLFGVVAHQIGFLEDEALEKARIYNWILYGIMIYGFSQLALLSPKQMGPIFIQVLVLIVLGLIGMFLASFLLAKPFHMSWQMAYCCSLTALFGFPMDYVLTKEIVEDLATSEGETQYLLDSMMPKMLVGGFATVSIASVVIASIFLKLL